MLNTKSINVLYKSCCGLCLRKAVSSFLFHNFIFKSWRTGFKFCWNFFYLSTSWFDWLEAKLYQWNENDNLFELDNYCSYIIIKMNSFKTYLFLSMQCNLFSLLHLLPLSGHIHVLAFLFCIPWGLKLMTSLSVGG